MEGLRALWFGTQSDINNFNHMEEIQFFVEDAEHKVKISEMDPETTLNSYLREKAHLTGTKNMCFEGGCGACIVVATVMNPVTKREEVLAVNSCLVPIYLCSGWKISTSDSIGNAKTGYHPVQKALVQFNGTQCGYCSSGMVMNMYALYESGKLTMNDVENSFGGNICRCTGYRSILSAFKSLASDASADLLGTYSEIEDIPLCMKKGEKCQSQCSKPCGMKNPHYYNLGKCSWFKVFSINEVLDILRQYPDKTYMIVGGNTATGVYKRTKEPDIYIDVRSVEHLVYHTMENDKLILGANMNLTDTMSLFYKLAGEKSGFAYLKTIADHIDLVANVPVRNMGTMAGNLSIKHDHHEFPSDIYLSLEAVGAFLTIVGTDHKEITKTLLDYLSFNMKGKIIQSITLPKLENYKYESYKIVPRAQNAHALLNAAFLLQLDSSNKVEKARIVYGGINPSFTHANNTENYLIGKSLFDNETLQGTYKTLEAELEPEDVLLDPSPEFRKQLAISLFYKFVLSITPGNIISERNKSGGQKFVRPISSGTQDFETNESLYPLTQPIPKIEALAQCSGSAKYIMDMPNQPDQLFAAFVMAKAPPNSVISEIDPSEALKLNGVVAFYDKKDIPGENNFVPKEGFPPLFQSAEELFCSGVVKYYYQPLGLIVASSQSVAEKAADMVEVTYIPSKVKPLVTIRDVLKSDAKDKIKQEGERKAKTKGDDVKHVIKGQFDIYWQYHYHMETQCCVAIPVEDGMDLFPSSQAMTIAQISAARVLNIPENKVNVSVRRLGGGYGGKITRNCMVSSAAALAAHILQKPVKLAMPLTANMNVIGKRFPCSSDYEVGVNDKGAIQYLNASVYTDLGAEGGNENLSLAILEMFGFSYKRDTWDTTMYSIKTDTHSGTACRAPGTTEGIAMAESVMEHISAVMNEDPLSVRLQNLAENPTMIKYIDELKEWADVDKRKKEVETFNKENRWVKRGLALVPMLYPFELFGHWNAHVSVYQGDGTVAISHGGIEMGQGINTKVAQTCAHALGIPLDHVSVKPSNILISPNCAPSGGSLTSEAVCYAVVKACEELQERMKATKEKMKNPTWKELVQQSYLENVNLCASSLFTRGVPGLNVYPIYGATSAEIEVDILTGQYQVKRVDLLEDTGTSASPVVDIGQVEGAFVMGMGYWTSEQIVYSKEAQPMTNRTWTYKPPGVKDIPVDFRVKFPKNNPNALSVLKSKATAEPPLCMACVVPIAIKHAVAQARIEADPKAEKWYPINGPASVENTFINSLHDYKQYTL